MLKYGWYVPLCHIVFTNRKIIDDIKEVEGEPPLIMLSLWYRLYLSAFRWSLPLKNIKYPQMYSSPPVFTDVLGISLYNFAFSRYSVLFDEIGDYSGGKWNETVLFYLKFSNATHSSLALCLFKNCTFSIAAKSPITQIDRAFGYKSRNLFQRITEHKYSKQLKEDNNWELRENLQYQFKEMSQKWTCSQIPFAPNSFIKYYT